MTTFYRHPVDAPYITGRFGDIYVLANGETYLHRGVDYGCPEGTPVYSPAAGTVVSPFNDGSFGLAVCVRYDEDGLFGLLAHLSTVLVSIGERIEAGGLVGLSGNTGASDGPHVHWQVCRSLAFPRDPAMSVDPLATLLEVSPMDPRVDALIARVDRLERLLDWLIQLIESPSGLRDGRDQAYALNAEMLEMKAALRAAGDLVPAVYVGPPDPPKPY